MKFHLEIPKGFSEILIITTFPMNRCHYSHFRDQNTVTLHDLNDLLSFTQETCSRAMKCVQI